MRKDLFKTAIGGHFIIQILPVHLTGLIDRSNIHTVLSQFALSSGMKLQGKYTTPGIHKKPLRCITGLGQN